MYDRLPTPFGLVRGGVAPDNQKIKSVTRVFDRLALHPEFRFYGNVEVGRDVSRADLHGFYDAVIYAVGAQTDRRLGIPARTWTAVTPARPSSAGTTRTPTSGTWASSSTRSGWPWSGTATWRWTSFASWRSTRTS